jgi:hypothetical protein
MANQSPNQNQGGQGVTRKAGQPDEKSGSQIGR